MSHAESNFLVPLLSSPTVKSRMTFLEVMKKFADTNTVADSGIAPDLVIYQVMVEGTTYTLRSSSTVTVKDSEYIHSKS